MKVVNGSWRSFEDVPAVVVVVDVDPACAGEVADLTEVCLVLFDCRWPTQAPALLSRHPRRPPVATVCLGDAKSLVLSP